MSGTLIAHQVLEQVELVIVLCIKPCPSPNDLGGDLRAVGVEVFLLYLLGYPLSSIFLGRGVVEDGRTVL